MSLAEICIWDTCSAYTPKYPTPPRSPNQQGVFRHPIRKLRCHLHRLVAFRDPLFRRSARVVKSHHLPAGQAQVSHDEARASCPQAASESATSGSSPTATARNPWHSAVNTCKPPFPTTRTWRCSPRNSSISFARFLRLNSTPFTADTTLRISRQVFIVRATVKSALILFLEPSGMDI
jgi:hypothetical protein